jgi:hypothetical protein
MIARVTDNRENRPARKNQSSNRMMRTTLELKATAKNKFMYTNTYHILTLWYSIKHEYPKDQQHFADKIKLICH